jgi:hypothetical protein
MTDCQTGCYWPVDYTGCSSCGDLPPEEQAVWEQIATDLLGSWTGNVFGVCTVELRPCQTGCADSNWATYWGRGPRWDPTFPSQGGPGVPFYPVLVGGKWFNVTCGCVGRCTCEPTGPTVLTLPGPVQTVDEVWVDGALLPASAYRLANKRHLIRVDGEVWPGCQDMLMDPRLDPDTFLVVYSKGLPVPAGGQMAAGRLACELALAACGSEECQLPDSMTALTRQGISMNFQDMTQGPEQVVTGIRSIDWWVASVSKPAAFASVRSYDTA